MTINPFRKTAAALIAAVAALSCVAGSASAATVTLDDFESYTAGQPIATAYNSTPWERFGNVEDQFYATTGSAMDGTLGGEIPVSVTGFSGASVLLHSGNVTDYSIYGSATVLSKSLNAPGGVSSAQISLAITDGNTTYQSDVPAAETATATSYTFLIDDANLMDVDDEAAPETLNFVLTHATGIGFRITSPQNVTATETLAFDDFTVTTTAVVVPEPATAGLALVGLAAGGLRRRRRA